MELGILGEMIVEVGGTNVAPTAPKVRKVLATLLVNAGDRVSVTSLMQELWEAAPPRSAATTLQTYILALRRTLAAAERISMEDVARNRLVTCSDGYVFRADPESMDAQRYRSLVAAGRRAVHNRDYRLGVEYLGAALAEWRGPIFGDVQVGSILESRRIEFEESRLFAAELLFDAELELGNHRDVLPELASLAAAHPLNEGLHLQYIRALCLGGRRAQALTVFARLRDTMVRELGIEPGLDLQRIRAAILNSDRDPAAHAVVSGISRKAI